MSVVCTPAPTSGAIPSFFLGRLLAGGAHGSRLYSDALCKGQVWGKRHLGSLETGLLVLCPVGHRRAQRGHRDPETGKHVDAGGWGWGSVECRGSLLPGGQGTTQVRWLCEPWALGADRPRRGCPSQAAAETGAAGWRGHCVLQLCGSKGPGGQRHEATVSGPSPGPGGAGPRCGLWPSVGPRAPELDICVEPRGRCRLQSSRGLGVHTPSLARPGSLTNLSLPACAWRTSTRTPRTPSPRRDSPTSTWVRPSGLRGMWPGT